MYGKEFVIDIAIDLGLTNIDVALNGHEAYRFFTMPNQRQPVIEELQSVLRALGTGVNDYKSIAVTGGQYRSLPKSLLGVPLIKVGEVDAIGRGGLKLANIQQALVVSAGSGTAMVAARPDACKHITGSAVGGGTLLGLSKLILGTTDIDEIDELAGRGDANGADLTLAEAIGGSVGTLPADANAVNFGRVPRMKGVPSPEDNAAALVRLVSQVIAVIAINAANAAGLKSVVVIGHLVDMPSIRHELQTVAGYYDADIRVPDNPGFGTALGALLHAAQGAG